MNVNRNELEPFVSVNFFNVQVAMLRRQKREISRENEEKSVKTDNFVQIEKFPSKNGRFCRLNIPPGYRVRKLIPDPDCIINTCPLRQATFSRFNQSPSSSSPG